MKSLFNKYEAYNEVGRLVSDELQAAIDPVMEKWAKKGYRVNDVESIAFDNVSISSAIVRMKRAARLANIRMEKSARLAKQEREKKARVQLLPQAKEDLK